MPIKKGTLPPEPDRERWTKYCGFLDLRLDEFMAIQQRLLMEQIKLMQPTRLGKRFMQTETRPTPAQFRRNLPITSYADYEAYFEEQNDDVLPQPAYLWARTSGRSGRMKWIPYTRQAYSRHGERVMSGVILGAARSQGDFRLQPGDTLVYNTPPRPYISGVSLMALAEQFDFNFIPPLELTEQLGFQERIELGFATALRTGIDVLGSMSVVLVKMGERFAEGANRSKISASLLHPQSLMRLLRGYLRSKLEGRPMLPRDLWKIKSLPTGGMDTSLYREKIAHFWGAQPYESYGSTETGVMACQAWNKKGMTFFPDAAFLEFIPEAEWERSRQDPSFQPATVLLDEIEVGPRYELVISSFYGMPLFRYRMHDLVRFTALADPETGVQLPQMEFAGRAADFIDLAGFSGLIDEKLVWQAILDSEIPFEEWALRKEALNGHPILHLYFEPRITAAADFVQQKIHASLKKLLPDFADYDAMIGVQSLKVTLLAEGTFLAYARAMAEAGADLAHLKPPHMNPTDQVIETLLGVQQRPGGPQ